MSPGLEIERPRPGEGSLKTAPAVALIGELAANYSYEAIADALREGGWRTAFGRAFTSQHVGYVCRKHGWGRGSHHAGVQELNDGQTPGAV